jgi:hypothetical protein
MARADVNKRANKKEAEAFSTFAQKFFLSPYSVHRRASLAPVHMHRRGQYRALVLAGGSHGGKLLYTCG